MWMGIASSQRTEWLSVRNFLPWAGQMVWCVKHLLCGVQIPRAHKMLEAVVCVCNSSTPLVEWKVGVGAGESMEIPRPPYTQQGTRDHAPRTRR